MAALGAQGIDLGGGNAVTDGGSDLGLQTEEAREDTVGTVAGIATATDQCANFAQPIY